MKKEQKNTGIIVGGIIIFIGLLWHLFNYSVVHETDPGGLHLAPGAKPASLYAFSVTFILIGLGITIWGVKRRIEHNKSVRRSNLIKFYQMCNSRGYTDMHDEIHSLKAKVIATDLGLDYKNNIASLYEKGKQIVEENRRELQKKQKEQAYIEAKRAVPGNLIVTITGSKNFQSQDKSVRIYQRADNSYYTTLNNGQRIEGQPIIEVKRGSFLEYTYHPSQTYYAGATVGGVTTGGIHQTQASYSEHYRKSNTGYIEVSIGGESFNAMEIFPSSNLKEAYKRDKDYRKLSTETGKIICYKSTSSNTYKDLAKGALGKNDLASAMSLMSASIDEVRLPYDNCLEIQRLLKRFINSAPPPSDEEIYKMACSLVASTESNQIKQAIDLFRTIVDYKDSRRQIEILSPKYGVTLQEEKERAIIEKEKKRHWGENKKKNTVNTPKIDKQNTSEIPSKPISSFDQLSTDARVVLKKLEGLGKTDQLLLLSDSLAEGSITSEDYNALYLYIDSITPKKKKSFTQSQSTYTMHACKYYKQEEKICGYPASDCYFAPCCDSSSCEFFKE